MTFRPSDGSAPGRGVNSSIGAILGAAGLHHHPWPPHLCDDLLKRFDLGHFVHAEALKIGGQEPTSGLL